jgi:hydroxylamine reductase
MKKQKEFTKETTFAELIEESPEFTKMLESRGLGCSGCPMASFDTIEGGAYIHGMDPDELVRELNEKRRQRLNIKNKMKNKKTKTNKVKK